MAANRPIDEKIVAMRMDNSDFAKKAAETTTIFGKLTNALNKVPGINFGKTARDLGDIQRSVNNTDMSGLSRAADMVSNRFSAMGVMATTTLVNITNRAVNAGLALQKSLTTDQLKAGFQEYELKMGSIQTILANTQRHGSTLKDVSKALDELNLYADKTIYNFGDMTKNIGLFTNAGLKLEESTSMIKGFSNAAAASGTNSENASRAAYQLSQGLSQGYIMTMDWMSLTNAGMGNDNMKRDLIAIGQAMGTLNKKTEFTLANWKDMLSGERWLTADVMSTYLQAMAGDLDKATLMTKGLTESQADMLIQNAKTGEESATYVRTFTQLMSTIKEGIGSGWAETWTHIFGDFEEATRLWTKFSNAIGDFFGKQAASRNEFLGNVADGGGFVNIFQGVQNAATAVVQALGAVGKAFKMVFPPRSFVEVIALTAKFRAFTAGLMMSEKTINNITTVFRGVFSVFSTLGIIIKTLVGSLLYLIPGFDGVGDGVLSLLAKVADWSIALNESMKRGNAFTRALSKTGEIISIVIGAIVVGVTAIVDFASALHLLENGGKVLDWIGEKLKPIGGYLKSAFGGNHINKANGELSLMEKITASISGMFEKFFGALVAGWEWVKGIFTSIGEFFGGLGEMIAANQGWILAGGGIAAMIPIVWKLWEIFSGFGRIGNNFAELIENVGDTIGAIKWGVWANSFLTAAIALGILAVSLKLLQGITWSEMGPALNGIIFSLAAMVGALAIISKYQLGGTMSATLALVGLGIAMALMAGAFKKMEGINFQEMGIGILGVAGLMVALAGGITLMSRFGKKQLAASSLQFVAIAASVLILTKALENIIAIDQGDLKRGIVALGVIILELGVFMALAGSTKFGIGASLGILAVAGSIGQIINSIKEIGKIDINVLKLGLAVIGGILAGIAIFSFIVGKDMLQVGLGILALAVALNALIIPIGILGAMDAKQLGVGIAALAVTLIALAVAAKIMNTAAVGALTIIALAVALNMLVVPLKILGSMSWKQLAVALVGLAASLLIVGGVAALLGTVSPLILAFAVAVAVLGLGMMAAGAGLSLFAKGLLMLTTLTIGAVGMIIGAIGAFITGFALLVPSITDLAMKIFVGFLNVVTRMIPKVADAIVRLITVIQEKIIEHMPGLMDRGADIIIAFIEGIEQNIPRMIIAAQNAIISFIEQMAIAMNENGPRLKEAWLQLMGSIILTIIDANTDMVNAFLGWIPGVKKASKEIGKTAEKYINENFGLDKLGEEKGKELEKGIKSKEKDVNESGKIIAEEGKKGVESVDTKESGENFTIGFANGITSKQDLVSTAASKLASAASGTIETELDIHSPSRVTHRLGEEAGVGFSKGIESKNPLVVKAAEGLAGGVEKGAKKGKGKAKKAGKSLADQAREGFREAVEMADYRLGMEEINDSQYLKEMERLRKVYSKHPEIVRELNLKIKRLRDTARKEEEQAAADAIKKKIDDEQKVFDKRKALIDDRKYYDKMTLKQELATWERLVKIYKEGSTQRAEAEREVYRIRKELNQKALDDERKLYDSRRAIIDDRKSRNEISLMQELEALKRMSKQYKAGSEERKEIDREIYRVKNEINNKLMESNKEYLEKVEAANQRLIDSEKNLTEAYENAVKDRAKSLSGFTGLFSKVSEASEVTGKELMDNLKGQAKTLVKWTHDMNILASRGIDEGLIEELRQMGPSAAHEIAALNSLTDAQLLEYSSIWQSKNELARGTAVNELEGLKEDTNKKIAELRAETTKELEQYKSEWITKVEEIRFGTEDAFIGLGTTMTQIGKDSISGLINGLKSMESPLVKQSAELAKIITKTIKDTLKIKSPSRATMADGEHAGQGLINGLANKVKGVADGAKALALTAKDSLNKFLEGFELPQEDSELHFTAVIDYDKFDMKRFGIQPVGVVPDTSFTNGMVDATKSSFRQNGRKVVKVPVDKSKVTRVDNGSKQPIIIQSVLNGRIIAEETFNDTNQLLYGQTNLDSVIKGV